MMVVSAEGFRGRACYVKRVEIGIETTTQVCRLSRLFLSREFFSTGLVFKRNTTAMGIWKM